METIKNYKQLMGFTNGRQINAQQVINGKLYHFENGWSSVIITPEFLREIVKEVSELYGGRANTKENIANTLRNRHPQHWGLGRTFLEDYGNGPAWRYCAGQDYPNEIRTIRNALK